ncbi:thioredoxin family protein [bacterium]|nr:thioredoxin family protein [bacterium]
MRNIITILLILILPIALYLTFNKNSEEKAAFANNAEKPYMYVFTSSMCMDCNKMKAVIKEIENDYNDKINIVYINALEKNKKVKEQIKKYGVTLVPTLVFADVNEVQTKKIEGSIPKEQLIIAIEDSINE